MTASQLITDIFSKVQSDVDANVRYLSRKQFDWLRSLIMDEAENGTVRQGTGASLVWAPAGRDKYILTEDLVRHRLYLTKLSNLMPSGMGRLF